MLPSIYIFNKNRTSNRSFCQKPNRTKILRSRTVTSLNKILLKFKLIKMIFLEQKCKIKFDETFEGKSEAISAFAFLAETLQGFWKRWRPVFADAWEQNNLQKIVINILYTKQTEGQTKSKQTGRFRVRQAGRDTQGDRQREGLTETERMTDRKTHSYIRR